MSIVQFDSQKIEQLLSSATSERQRKMYIALLDKARSQERSSTDSSAPLTNPSTEKKVRNGSQTLTKEKSETKKKTQSVKKNQKANRQSATTKASTLTIQFTKPVTESSKLTPDSSEQTPSEPSIGKNKLIQDYLQRSSGQKEDPLPTTPETSQPSQGASDVAAQTELKSQSQKAEKQQPDNALSIFQGLGAVIATPYLQDDLLKVAINGCEYDLLYVPGLMAKAWNLLRAELEKNGSSPMFLRLYPNAKFNRKLQQSRLSFSLVYFSRDCEKINDEPNGFVLRGIWQYITQYQSPVISIYRNGCGPQLEFFKKLNPNQQLYFAQPHHIPVVWNTTIEPFKFNPQAKKGSQMPRYFVEVRATLKDEVYVVEEMLSEPTLKIPKLIKASTPRLDKLGKPQRPSRSKKKQPKSVKKTEPKSAS